MTQDEMREQARYYREIARGLRRAGESWAAYGSHWKAEQRRAEAAVWARRAEQLERALAEADPLVGGDGTAQLQLEPLPEIEPENDDGAAAPQLADAAAANEPPARVREPSRAERHREARYLRRQAEALRQVAATCGAARPLEAEQRRVEADEVDRMADELEDELARTGPVLVASTLDPDPPPATRRPRPRLRVLR